jgi:histidinol phosphatase-like enzyme (inositol monophosphatase family)
LEPGELEAYLAFAHRLADLSADAIMPHFRNLEAVEDKSGGKIYDPVTTADRHAEEVIRDEVAKTWPGHEVHGEEFGKAAGEAEFCWLVDPIDGTRPFIMGWPVWGTLIGLARRGTPLLGIMNQPFTGERFWGSPAGAFCTGPGGEQRLATRSCPKPGEAILASSSPDLFATPEDEERFGALSQKVRMRYFGGDCYAYCMLAAGHVDLVVESGLSPHDIVPLIPIIQGAGGKVTTWTGEDAAAGGAVVACGDPALHGEVLKVLSG